MKKYFLFLLLLLIVPFIALAYIGGDVDGDNKIGASDYVAIRNHLLNKNKLSDDKLKIADVNNDGKISSLDYIMIRKMIINGVTPTPVVTTTPFGVFILIPCESGIEWVVKKKSTSKLLNLITSFYLNIQFNKDCS